MNVGFDESGLWVISHERDGYPEEIKLTDDEMDDMLTQLGDMMIEELRKVS